MFRRPESLLGVDQEGAGGVVPVLVVLGDVADQGDAVQERVHDVGVDLVGGVVGGHAYPSDEEQGGQSKKLCLEQNTRLLVVKHKLNFESKSHLEQNTRLLVVKHKLMRFGLSGRWLELVFVNIGNLARTWFGMQTFG